MTAEVSKLIPAFIIEDLLKSGLSYTDMNVRLSGPNEKAATNTPLGVDAYTIPYYDINGRILPFYRNKLLNSPEPDVKYKQLTTSGNHVYFPPGLAKLLPNAKYLLVTEGEKKAAKAVKEGFPCVGLGGVDSWKNRTITLHKDTQMGQSPKGNVVVKIPAGAEINENIESLATGFREVIQHVMYKGIPIIICYDTDLDVKGLVKFEVQRAAAMLGFELRHRGVKFPMIRQLILNTDPNDPDQPHTGKLGLDDYLVHEALGPDYLHQAISDVLNARQAFPQHPNCRDYVNKKLQKTSISRNDMAALSTAIVCDLDVNGMRLHCPEDDNMYYFDTRTHRLLKVHFTQHMEFAKTAFGKLIYDMYGITQADQRLISVLNSQFCGEEPISKVRPEKVMTLRGDNLYFQISDGEMVKVNSTGLRIVLNGTDGVLFEGDMVEPLNKLELQAAIARYSGMDLLPNLWYETLKDARIKETPNDKMRKLLSLLYSISPWMYRWRATQLPLEQMLGEAGSGKSTLYKMRQIIISGRSYLRNAPASLKDWTASVASASALHVTDNVHMTGGQLKQQLSDELCRVITEDDPMIEARKLYTDNDLVRVPVTSVFAVTAIKQPFTNTDIIQRSIIAELDKGTELIEYDADWAGTQIAKFHGRAGWVGHQLVFMHRLFSHIQHTWNPKYKARYRLINVEQLLQMAAQVYGWDSSWVAGFLEQERDEMTAKSDAVIEALLGWVEQVRGQYSNRDLRTRRFFVNDITTWASTEDDYEDHPIMTNPRKLGHYIEDKKNTLAHIAGFAPTGLKYANRKTYMLLIPEGDDDAETTKN